MRNVRGPLHSGHQLGQGIDVKVKSKIWAEEYIPLGSLIFKQSSAKLEAVQGKDNSFTFQQKEVLLQKSTAVDECLSYLRSGVLREMPCASALFNEIHSNN